MDVWGSDGPQGQDDQNISRRQLDLSFSRDQLAKGRKLTNQLVGTEKEHLDFGCSPTPQFGEMHLSPWASKEQDNKFLHLDPTQIKKNKEKQPQSKEKKKVLSVIKPSKREKRKNKPSPFEHNNLEQRPDITQVPSHTQRNQSLNQTECANRHQEIKDEVSQERKQTTPSSPVGIKQQLNQSLTVQRLETKKRVSSKIQAKMRPLIQMNRIASQITLQRPLNSLHNCNTRIYQQNPQNASNLQDETLMSSCSVPRMRKPQQRILTGIVAQQIQKQYLANITRRTQGARDPPIELPPQTFKKPYQYHNSPEEPLFIQGSKKNDNIVGSFDRSKDLAKSMSFKDLRGAVNRGEQSRNRQSQGTFHTLESQYPQLQNRQNYKELFDTIRRRREGQVQDVCIFKTSKGLNTLEQAKRASSSQNTKEKIKSWQLCNSYRCQEQPSLQEETPVKKGPSLTSKQYLKIQDGKGMHKHSLSLVDLKSSLTKDPNKLSNQETRRRLKQLIGQMSTRLSKEDSTLPSLRQQTNYRNQNQIIHSQSLTLNSFSHASLGAAPCILWGDTTRFRIDVCH